MLQEHDISDIEYRKLYNDMETRNTDWFKRLTRRSFSHSHNVSVSGGTNKFSYSASMGYNNSEGQEIGNDNERMTGRIALMLRPIEKLTISMTLNGSVSTTNGFFDDINPMGYATNTNRIIDPMLIICKKTDTIIKQEIKKPFHTISSMNGITAAQKHAPTSCLLPWMSTGMSLTG